VQPAGSRVTVSSPSSTHSTDFRYATQIRMRCELFRIDKLRTETVRGSRAATRAAEPTNAFCHVASLVFFIASYISALGGHPSRHDRAALESIDYHPLDGPSVPMGLAGDRR
jgi:hypothetical protein